ncbi:MAG TPA: M20/M25/M40 family metallo-hydrolase, partial [Pyrinomonadaceae bacterium]|nr:M20/M25/M40 family metallo-hydrolase [Pyrinomonadaceae bacterium]
MPFTRFDRYVDRHANAFVERLQTLCRMPSVAARGTGMRAMAERVEQLMRQTGAGTKTFKIGSGFPIVFGEFGAGAACHVVYGHYDVQPVGQISEWSSGPFAGVVKDGRLYGRGAANGKGDLVARLAAVEAYQKTFGKLPLCLRFVVEGEDGLGSPSLYRFTREQGELLKGDGCVWDDGHRDTKGRLVVSLGFKGISFVELRAVGARADLHSKWGGIVPNPAWRLVQALSTIVSPSGVITIDGFASHVAPMTEDDARALRSVELDEKGLRSEFRIGGWVRGLSGRALAKELIFGPTCTICGIQTGHTEAGPKTVLPGMARARLDFRLVPDLTPELVVSLLGAHLKARGFADIEVAEIAGAPYAKASPKSTVARASVESAAEVYGVAPVVYPLDPASGPVGVVCGVSQPPTPVVSFGVSHPGSNPHAPDENIRLDGRPRHGRLRRRLGVGRAPQLDDLDVVEAARVEVLAQQGRDQ